MNALVRMHMRTLAQQAQRFGPYLLLELLLPGGTLFALLLFLYRNRPLRSSVEQPIRRPAVVAQVVTQPPCGASDRRLAATSAYAPCSPLPCLG